MFVRQFDIDKGQIKLLGGREIMLHASAILELQEIDESKIYEAAKQSGMKNLEGAVEHAKVYGKMKDVFLNEISKLGEKIGNNEEGVISTLQEIFNIYGLGEMTIHEIDNKSNKALIIVRDSALAGEYISSKRTKSKTGVCTLTSGVLAGMFSYIFGKKVDCKEEKCKAQGNAYCLFRIG